MGLPIWRDPTEKQAARDTVKADPTAAARSAIRRRASIHGRRSSRPRLTRDATIPRFERSPPPSVGFSFSGLREPRRGTVRGVPPVSTLLESADRHGAPPPPPVPESRNYYDDPAALERRERFLRENIERLHERAGHLERRTRALRETSNSRDVGVGEPGPRPARSSMPTQRLEALHRLSLGGRTSSMERRSHSSRSQPRGVARTHRSTLPTPPLDASPDADSLFLPESQARSNLGSHPLSNSWNADAPIDGLGDRNRSPTPADGWEIMRSTITPDATLPSADSSFTSAAASHSFTSSNDTNITEPDHASATVSSNDSRRNSEDDSQTDTASSVDPEDLICDDERLVEGVEAYADDMYDSEMATREGRERILTQERIRARDGNRFALAHESDRIDVGFRLIEEALNTEEGRQRLLPIGGPDGAEDVSLFEDVVDSRRNPSSRHGQIPHLRARRADVMDDEPPSPHPERYSDETRNAAREATAQVHDYFRRFSADALQSRASARSPPPQYEPLGSHPDVNTFTSRDGPVAHPVSPPTQRSRTEVVDGMLGGDATDLAAMRRIVERLARRDDVPEEWWMSMGLNVSRTRPRALSPRRSDAVAGNRVRSGRIERGNSRL
ncbi:hypothetical protein LTR36_005170 [Oleoguttula mirabilis]|uniref:Uncharacterized protein n=1 Tax=Oleoguttula mirabilis TaxID=1507867 RepID=A0AAV9JVV7_9PEZI|nr:hypothetical protein LTR36_005170 [Oleoguttula mirabilis]